MTFLNAAGDEVPVIANLTPIIVDGKVVGVAGAAHDMTNERQFERELLRGRERFRTLFESSPSAIAAFTPDGIITEVNVAMERLSGYRNEELVGKHASVLVPPEYGDDANARVARVLSGEVRTFHLELRSRGGANVSLEADVLPIVIDGRAEGVFMIGKDLTREEALARLDQRDERMRALYRIASSPDFAGASQIDNALALGAQALAMEYGYVSRYVDGISTVEHRIGPAGVLPLHSTFATIPSVGASIVSSPRATTVNDMTIEPYASQLRERGLHWKSYIGGRVMVGGEPYGLLVFCSDRVRRPAFEQADRDFIDLMCALIGSAIARQALQDELSKMAFHDSLTGLANRALLEEHLTRAIHLAQRSNELVAVHYLDLNRFKPVNDAYGHAAGDQVLREVARRFTAAVRAQDIVARIGGDEFVVLQTNVYDDEPVRLLAARLRASMKEKFPIGNGRVADVGVSVGTAIFPRDAIDAPGLLRFADAAMYREKELRRTAV